VDTNTKDMGMDTALEYFCAEDPNHFQKHCLSSRAATAKKIRNQSQETDMLSKFL
jgi:hypothetical protein